jgi:hypothetical protein
LQLNWLELGCCAAAGGAGAFNQFSAIELVANELARIGLMRCRCWWSKAIGCNWAAALLLLNRLVAIEIELSRIGLLRCRCWWSRVIGCNWAAALPLRNRLVAIELSRMGLLRCRCWWSKVIGCNWAAALSLQSRLVAIEIELSRIGLLRCRFWWSKVIDCNWLLRCRCEIDWLQLNWLELGCCAAAGDAGAFNQLSAIELVANELARIGLLRCR